MFRRVVKISLCSFSVSYPKFMLLWVIPNYQAPLVVGAVTAERVHSLPVPETPAVWQVCATYWKASECLRTVNVESSVLGLGPDCHRKGEGCCPETSF